jgi:peroxiredoxin
MFYVTVPDVTFKTRVQTDESPGFAWKNVSSEELFNNKRVVLFSLPGAFTPTCSSTHLPGFEAAWKEITENYQIDDIYCLSVNDSFVMNAWFKSLGIQKVKPIPDGSGEFTRKMGMLVDKDNLGFGMRSWRYSAVIGNGIVEKIFVEPGYGDNVDGDPFQVSDVDTMLEYLRNWKEAVEKRRAAAEAAQPTTESAS